MSDTEFIPGDMGFADLANKNKMTPSQALARVIKMGFPLHFHTKFKNWIKVDQEGWVIVPIEKLISISEKKLDLCSTDKRIGQKTSRLQLNRKSVRSTDEGEAWISIPHDSVYEYNELRLSHSHEEQFQQNNEIGTNVMTVAPLTTTKQRRPRCKKNQDKILKAALTATNDPEISNRIRKNGKVIGTLLVGELDDRRSHYKLPELGAKNYSRDTIERVVWQGISMGVLR